MPTSSNRAIVVEDLGKQYSLGARSGPFRYGSLRESMTNGAARLLRRLRGARASDGGHHIWALSEVSLTIDRGEVVGIIGANGAGKSTLLKILSRITKPTTGFAELRGRVGTLLEVGTGFHPELSGRDNIFLSGTILGMHRAEIERRFDEIVAFSGVEKFIDTPVKRYSSGMYVRLAFAVAAHLEPEILLVDEVLAVGDAEFQSKCLGKMESVVRDGRTILFVSHNMAAIKTLCPRAVLFEGGRLVADGHVDAVVDRYLSKSRTLSARGHIAPDVPRVGSGEARLRQITMLDGNGAEINQVYLGQPFRLVVTIDVLQPVRDVLIGVGISTRDGTRVATSFSSDGGRSSFDLDVGRHRIAIDVDVTLLPRPYTIDGIIVRATGYDVDSLNRVLDFTALNVAASGVDSYRWDTVRGYIRPHAVWHELEHLTMEQVLR